MTRPLSAILLVQVIAITSLLMIALDQYAHKRVEAVGGFNTWGYRGAIARVRAPNEVRIGVLGGSLAFGWGVAASETMISEVRRLVALVLDVPGKPAVVVSAINVAALGLPPDGFSQRIARFAALDFDVLCLYPDPVGFANGQFLPPADSAVTMLTGYAPVLPLVIEEKSPVLAPLARAWRYVDRLAHRVVVNRTAGSDSDASALVRSTRTALDLVPRVVLVLPPPSVGSHTAGFESVPRSLLERPEPRLRIVDLSLDPVLHEPQSRLDQLNLGVGGHARAAEQIAPAVIDLLATVNR